jgi:hypothetical protein
MLPDRSPHAFSLEKKRGLCELVDHVADHVPSATEKYDRAAHPKHWN